jgi:ABC-type phosphate transport system substrate-binding protein
MLIAKHVKAGAAGFVLSLCANAADAEVVVIVSVRNPTVSLSIEQVSNIFLGKASTFPYGGRVIPIDQEEGAPARDEFYLKATGKKFAQIKAYWSKIIFTGSGQPPKETGDSEVVRKLVADNPNLLGYIDKNAADASVKVVLTLR